MARRDAACGTWGVGDTQVVTAHSRALMEGVPVAIP